MTICAIDDLTHRTLSERVHLLAVRLDFHPGYQRPCAEETAGDFLLGLNRIVHDQYSER
jgi:hypothetical protein